MEETLDYGTKIDSKVDGRWDSSLKNIDNSFSHSFSYTSNLHTRNEYYWLLETFEVKHKSSATLFSAVNTLSTVKMEAEHYKSHDVVFFSDEDDKPLV